MWSVCMDLADGRSYGNGCAVRRVEPRLSTPNSEPTCRSPLQEFTSVTKPALDRSSRHPRLALLLMACAVLSPIGAANAQEAAPPASLGTTTQDPRAFIDMLASNVFAILRNHSIPEAERRRTFRAMLSDNFAIVQIGDRLIRRHRATITPAQYAAYRAAFPAFVVGTYADRLEGFETASLKTTRIVPRGGAGDADVFARVTMPQRQPIDTVWAVRNQNGRLVITNLTVSGINLALTQEADFDSYIQRQGFDALVAFMKKSQA